MKKAKVEHQMETENWRNVLKKCERKKGSDFKSFHIKFYNFEITIIFGLNHISRKLSYFYMCVIHTVYK